ncbi:Protein-L-isoaspartate(D-aspartate)O-methyltrans ferase [Beutenbergia cavernae DSM 12333]|uniref:Protein-L-isoaspartate O-methyltransferase n=1 Tax=Beutenbergia cavernae (strain ATCC BAA-8 / DSM 12333 / CCUG 43141 / JCM 11478 / NBRC 16432 / NCIMB 13614 / HKI 0122) TaxID=471853 RepID=C5BWD9_BEUC1|nr:methyltransferase domain-containing protein [Beutenbergia cavernae]ACQ78597.1 Protein-L-isoaspartate(D-aspartate)O-methyltrans ferase [Beutenbergia cavernae DSM 12333]
MAAAADRTAERERRVDDAFAAVRRAPFLPRQLRHRAGDDAPLPIGHGATCSQPRTVRDMLLLLDPRPGHRVLDVGSGSGWTTALLAHLVAPDGAVVGVDLEEELVATSRAALAHAGLLDDETSAHEPATRTTPDPASGVAVVVHVAPPHTLGWPAAAPYDRILVSAQAAREVPDALLDQLAPTGVMVIPVRGELVVVDQDEGGRRLSAHGAYRFVPLRQ